MNIVRWVIGLAVIGVLIPSAVFAQAVTANGLRQPAGAQRTAYEYDNYLPGSPQGEVAVAPSGPAAAPAPTASPAGAQAALAPVASGDASECCDPDAPWTVPQPCFFQNLGIKWGGWLQVGATANAWNPPSHFNGPLATNDRNEFEMNQMWLYFDRPVKTDGCGWDLGGHVDVVYGSDWRFGMNPGLENRINGADQLYGMILPQAYMEVGVNDLSVKMGHFATGFGYEGVPAVGNFFYSHSYAMCYTEPLLVTGVQADYKLNDCWTATAGFNRGWMMFEDLNTSLDFLGGIRYRSCDKRTGLSFMVTSGPEWAPPWVEQDPNAYNRFAYSLVYQRQVTEQVEYVLQHNLGCEAGTSTVDFGRQASWYGLNQYLFYTINPCWKAGLRFEWLRDNDGTRVLGVGNWIQSDKGWLGAPGFAGDFYEMALGLNWRPHPNFTVRPEVRWDWYSGRSNLLDERPFNDGHNSSQFTAAVDLITTF